MEIEKYKELERRVIGIQNKLSKLADEVKNIQENHLKTMWWKIDEVIGDSGKLLEEIYGEEHNASLKQEEPSVKIKEDCNGGVKVTNNLNGKKEKIEADLSEMHRMLLEQRKKLGNLFDDSRDRRLIRVIYGLEDTTGKIYDIQRKLNPVKKKKRLKRR